ncbi:MAG: histidinol-phosphate aminotransferase family protein [Chitinophagaceae bacterium]|nr:histidinol-phosphate aminotransferase family protein [Chitinophagaceae bacterium]
MAHSMNRRAWLKATSLLTGGLAVLPGQWNTLAAAPAATKLPYQSMNDFEFGETVRPKLKARLFANENPFGPSDKAKQAIMESLNTSYQYPMRSGEELAEKIVAFEGLKPEMLMMSAGSSAILAAAAIYFSKDGGNIVTGDPTYDDLPDRAQQIKATWKKVPLTPEFKLDLDAMEKAVDANTKLVYICNPNNPTATIVDTQKLRDFCERVSKKTTVFVDEAYIDYLPDPKASTMIDCVKQGHNVIVARTFSKLYGFAGLRVGYAVLPADLATKLEPFSSGLWSMSAPAIQAALASYQDREFLDGALKKTLASKDYLYQVLKTEGYTYIPSSTNFVMFPINMPGERFTDEMMKRGVGLRHWEFNNKSWCRISIGRMGEMQAFAEAFKEVS